MRMKSIAAFLGFAAILAMSAANAGEIEDLVAALSGDDASTQASAYEGAGRFGPEAIPAVAPLLDCADPAVARAAKVALEKIVGAASDSETTRAAASAALCGAAEDARTRRGRDWLLWLLSYTGGPEAVPTLLALMESPDAFNMAVFALQAIAGDEAAAGLADKLPAARDTERVAIINALGAIGGDKAVQALIQEAKCPESSCCCALYEALGRAGDPSARAILWEKYKGCRCPNALSAYLMLAEQQQPARARRMYADLLAASDTEPKAVAAAIVGLGHVGKSGAARRILPYLASERPEVRGVAVEALMALKGHRVDRLLRARYGTACPALKRAILEVLHTRDAKEAVPMIERAMDCEDIDVRITALELLGETPEVRVTYTGRCLDIARQGAEGERAAALQAYTNAADEVMLAGDAQKALGMYHAALDLAETHVQRKQPLAGMAAIASPRSLPYLQRFVGEEELHNDLAVCALSIAEKLTAEDRDKAATIFDVVLSGASNRALIARAARGLEALGLGGAAARRGCITRWDLIGPFPYTDFNLAYPPEVEYKRNARYEGADGAQVAWATWETDDPAGVAPLHEIYTSEGSGLAYGRAIVKVSEAQDVLVKMGSNDGIACWLNGAAIHQNEVGRTLVLDSDIQRAHLEAGENVILVKITQYGGGWEFCVRLTDLDGHAIAFTQ